jgi:hypothetical protein
MKPIHRLLIILGCSIPAALVGILAYAIARHINISQEGAEFIAAWTFGLAWMMTLLFRASKGE